MQFYKEMIFIFSGIGTDYRQIIHKYDLYSHDLLQNYMQRAYNVHGINLMDFFNNKQVENQVLHNWIGIYTLDCVIFEKYRSVFLKPRCLMGYSMGLITALQCGKALSYEDGIELLIEIRRNHKVKSLESMSAIIGLDYTDIMDLINKHSLNDKVFIASENNNQCFIVSGMKDAILHLNKIAESKGGRIGYIDADYAFHTKLLKKCSSKINDVVNKMKINNLELPLLSSIDQRWIINQEDIKKELVNNLFNKMCWEKSILKATEDNNQANSEFIEVSLGKSLTNSSQIISKSNIFHTYDSIFG